MKTKLFTIALALASMNISAQVTVTDTDLMTVGDIIYEAYDTVPAPSISLGNAGPNQTWDFSALQVQELHFQVSIQQQIYVLKMMESMCTLIKIRKDLAL